MAQRAGTANLPLHGGQVPRWLADRMTRLGAVISEAMVHHYGRDELLRRLAHPFWFQSFGAVMGMDWHSSGITTSVIGALKRGLAPLEQEAAANSRRGRAHRASLGYGRRGRAWSPLSLHRPGSIFVRARREGQASLPCAAAGL